MSETEIQSKEIFSNDDKKIYKQISSKLDEIIEALINEDQRRKLAGE